MSMRSHLVGSHRADMRGGASTCGGGRLLEATCSVRSTSDAERTRPSVCFSTHASANCRFIFAARPALVTFSRSVSAAEADARVCSHVHACSCSR